MAGREQAKDKAGKAPAARREARPIPWGDLTDQQRSAAVQASRVLGDIASQSFEPSERRSRLERFLPPIDEERLNHVILLDGGRGVGKTALLVTMLNWWRERLLQEDRTLRRSRSEAEPEQEALKEIRELTRDVVPVGMVDLQPLPPSTNLLMHLVGQFLPLVEALEQGEQDTSGTQRARQRAPWHDIETDEHPATKAWREFLRAAAAGWDGSLPERRAKLDPEAYALELEQSERQRLDVRLCFRKLVDELAKHFADLVPSHMGRAPLFVIPIDDADMNPHRVVELLDLLRTLWHPRVAFLLTGQSELFLTVLRAQALAGLRAPLRTMAAFGSDDVKQLEGISAALLARNIYDKVIPTGHRCPIPEIVPERRFRILQREGVLRLLPAFDHALRMGRIEDYFILQPQAQELLPGNLRKLRDLASAVHARAAHAGRPESATPPDPWSGQARLPRQMNALVRELIDITGDLALLQIEDEEARLDELAGRKLLDFHSWQAHWRAIRLEMQSESSFVFVVHDRIPRSERELAEIVLLSDLAGRDPLPGNPMQAFVVARDVSVRGKPVPLRIVWPLPSWKTPLDYAAFYYLWTLVMDMHSEADWQADVRADLGRVARRFLASVIDYIRLRRNRLEQPIASEQAPLLEALKELADDVREKRPDWSSLARELVELAGPVARPSESTDAAWARGSAGLLATPESGLKSTDANAWLDALKGAFHEEWEDTSALLHAQRLLRVEVAMKPDTSPASPPEDRDPMYLGDVLSRMSQGRDGYRWEEDIAAPSDNRIDEFIAAIRDVEVDAGEPMGRPTLAHYFEGGRAEAIREAAPFSLLRRWRERIVDATSRKESPAHIVAGFWADAAEQSLVPRIDMVATGANMRTLLAFYEDLNDSWSLRTGPSMDVGPELRVAKLFCGRDEPIWDGYPLAEPLFECLWDVLADESDGAPIRESDNVAWWDGAGGRRDAPGWMSVYRWPCIDWYAFIDWRVFVDHWNDLFDFLEEKSISRPADRMADSVARWYVETLAGLARGVVHRPISLAEVAEVDFGQILFKASDVSLSLRREGRRTMAYRVWLRALPLLAAPESGLSLSAASQILKVVSEEERRRLYHLRRERMHARRPPRARVEAWLKEINRKNPEHPWVTLIEHQNQ